jgi:hypothetical protein
MRTDSVPGCHDFADGAPPEMARGSDRTCGDKEDGTNLLSGERSSQSEMVLRSIVKGEDSALVQGLGIEIGAKCDPCLREPFEQGDEVILLKVMVEQDRPAHDTMENQDAATVLRDVGASL